MFAFIFNIYLEELIFMYDIIILFLLFIIYSFLGWIIETVACSIYYKIVADRGFLIGPICPIYGVSALFMIIVLKRYNKDVIVLFAMAFLLCSISYTLITGLFIRPLVYSFILVVVIYVNKQL